jgi:hypothetical protein
MNMKWNFSSGPSSCPFADCKMQEDRNHCQQEKQMNQAASDMEHREPKHPGGREYDKQDQPGIHCQPPSDSLQSLMTWRARFLSGRQLRMPTAKLYLLIESPERGTTMSHHTPQVQPETEQYRSPASKSQGPCSKQLLETIA